MLRNVRLLFGKELLGAVRDRRTLFLTVLFPLIFYPLVLSVMSRFGEAERTRIETLTPAVLVVDRAADETFARELAGTDAFSSFTYDGLAGALADLEDDVGQIVMTVDKAGSGEGLGLEVVLYYDQTDQFAVIAAGRVRAFFEAYLKRVVNEKLVQLGQPSFDELTPPLTVTAKDVATQESLGRLILSRLLPYFMVLAILTGAMGLGAEVTAGEKERHTIATLLVSQLSRTEIVLGKFFAILTVSLVSSLLSAAGLMIGIRLFGGGLVPTGGATSAAFQLDLSAFGWMLVVLLPLAVILAALVVIVGSFARSQKEASTYLLPIYMVIVLVGMMSMTGSITFEGIRYLIPIANALYALQAIIVGDLVAADILLTLGANIFCGALLIAAAVRVFKREAVLFRS